MKHLLQILQKAKHSGFYLWILNHLLWRVIPFNKSHRVYIKLISDETITVLLPYKKSNLNHLKGMHACALATLCEYTCGIGLMTRINPDEYRIILKEIKMDYFLQAKTDIQARFDMNDRFIQNEIIQPLQTQGNILKKFTVKAYDTADKVVCVGEITWHLKHWDKVTHKRKSS